VSLCLILCFGTWFSTGYLLLGCAFAQESSTGQTGESGFSSIVSTPIPSLTLFESKDRNDPFIGYFIPVNGSAPENFQTCSGRRFRVEISSVVEYDGDDECGSTTTPFTSLKTEKFWSMAKGSVVFDQSGVSVGKVMSAIIDEKGGISGYLISESPKYAASDVLVLNARSATEWFDGSMLAIVAKGDPVLIPDINAAQISFGDKKLQGFLTREFGASKEYFDLGVTLKLGTILPFKNVSVLTSPEQEY
jgi:hypothetical protein